MGPAAVCAGPAAVCAGSVVAVCVLSCPVACGILGPGPEIKSVSSAGGFLTTGLPKEVP